MLYLENIAITLKIADCFWYIPIFNSIYVALNMVYHNDWEELNDLEGPKIPKFSSSYLFVSVLFAKIIPYTRGKYIVYFHCVNILKLLRVQ